MARLMQGKRTAAAGEGAVIHVWKVHLERERLRFAFAGKGAAITAHCQKVHRKFIRARAFGHLADARVFAGIKEYRGRLRCVPRERKRREWKQALALGLRQAPSANPGTVKGFRSAGLRVCHFEIEGQCRPRPGASLTTVSGISKTSKMLFW
jgi:hypothetical protein